ncbi:MAG: NAD(P)H-hydrate epimerase [Phycisphaerae bacterium]|nr:NAD(P)H-hydrate epimerase [Phycisphaerae bacterium]
MPVRPVKRDEIRRIDRYAIETLGIPGLVLMENAGRNAADVVQRTLTRRGGAAAAVVAGAGNNGGDGFVIARHLHLRGYHVNTFLMAAAEKVSGDAAVNLAALRALACPIHEIADDVAGGLANLSKFAVVVDAIGGTGITGALRGSAAEAVEAVNAAARPVVAVDIPTGLDCDAGAAEGPVVRAVATVTMLAPKAGFAADGADAYTGEVLVADIGIPAEQVARAAGVDLTTAD